MTRQEKRTYRRIERRLKRLEAVDLDQWNCEHVNEIDAYIDEVKQVGYVIVKSFRGLYPRVNRIHRDAVQKRRVMVDVQEMLTW